MEPTVVSGPLGHTQWDPEQPFPLGFQPSNSGGVLCPKSGQAGLDDKHDTFPKGEEENLFVDKPFELDSFIKISSDFYKGDLHFEGGQPMVSQASHLQELSCADKTEGLDGINDCTLSWLFSSNFPDVSEKTTASEELTFTQNNSLEGSNVLGGQADLINLSVPSSPASRRNPETNAADPFLLVDLSDELSCFAQESTSEPDLHGVTVEQAGLPPLQTLSPETGDKGLFPDQVTDLPITCSATVQGLLESCQPRSHVGKPQEHFEGSVPLLDLDVPDFDSSLCPASPASDVCSGTPLEVSTDESGVANADGALIRNFPPEEISENDSHSQSLPDKPSLLTLALTQDACCHDDLTSERNSVESVSEELMDKKICVEAGNRENGEMALDLCLTVEEVPDDGESWDPKPHEDLKTGSALSPKAEQREVDRLTDAREAASFDFSVQDINLPSSETGWTSEQTVETISPSKMVGDDSLPMVSAVTPREEDVSPLKAVFDALDQDGDGFVRIEEFMEFAAAYGADQVKDLTKFLDPSGLGVISFEDFHRGISAISNGGPEPQLYNVNYSPGDGAVGCPEEYDEQNEVTDSAYLGSESTYSECETFTDEDTGALVPPEMHEDVETDSGIEATLHDPEDGGNRFSLNSELHNHSLVTVIGGEEEHFEDFGESNTSELLLETSVEGSVREGDSLLAQTPEQVNGSSLLSPSAGKRLSSKKVARHLLQNSSMTLDTMSDLTRDILELADNDITDKVLLLERRVAELEKESEASGEQHARLRQENLQLVHRANALEEQLKEQELQADEQLQQETRRHKEALSKLEREKELELENLQARLQQLDDENSELRSCVPCLRANIERLEEEKRKLQDEVETVSDRLQDETESRRKMADKLSHERHQNQKEKENTQEVIEDLRKQLEHLQLYKLEAEAKRGRTPGAGLQEYQTRTREAELEQEIRRLKQDNRSLKEQNDELNGQIINLSIQGAKNLMSASFSDSLAAEISSVSRSELMEAVHKQEEINYRLQDYIDKIIVAIMESNPSILEVK
ncbi:rab11 family-interacting protein 3 isoform X2 [Kryptolebias marmoratus]|uniref:RAB11 family interacting protein 3 (class II) n=1 Tax=Kryptolebias marmoratus TaxID=37003 RepID=A0A3Q3ALX6_KRYMA|nr:rab11 family-interacting protein 3 isoform X2 [Kryptolebias marmoratus]